ncbi:MAG: sulfite exporter TauE/SafE family protein [Planctomycetota bacterium]|nr:MAG: sulfite exporter TauE/SafE family protein [Planctomycetota bacterium]
MTWIQAAIAVVAGGGVGFLAGVFGIGGAFLLVPVLQLTLTLPVQHIVGSVVCYILGPATAALLARDVRADDLRLPLTTAGGLLVGVSLGTRLLHELKGTAGGHGASSAELAVSVGYLLTLSLVGGFLVWESRRTAAGRPLSRGYLQRWRLPPSMPLPGGGEAGRVSVPVVCWFAVGVGVLGGFLGISGGLVLMPGLVYLFGVKTQKAVVASLVIAWLVAFQGTIAHGWYGNVDLLLVACLLVGGTVGARIGSAVGQRWKGAKLRERFGWLVVFAALLVVVKLAVLQRSPRSPRSGKAVSVRMGTTVP